jgi:CheY-like chemotaxis protein
MTRDGKDCLTALVVDDYADSRRILRRMLELRRFRVVEASDGVDAVEFTRRECSNLILMDLNMPRMDGLEAGRKIRELKECEDVVLIAFTAFDIDGMREAAGEAGFDDYLVKPFGFEQLDAVLRRYWPK